jgi:16S rRNA pseudouridine516 synthase
VSKGPPTLRLDRLLSNLGYGSRREVQQLLDLGLVSLDGVTLRDGDQRIAVTPDLSARMLVDDEPLDPPPGLALMLHKPVGVTCSHKEQGPLVYKLLPERWRRREPTISSVGRLDKDTSGLLLLTDDGALLHARQRRDRPAPAARIPRYNRSWSRRNRSARHRCASATPQTRPNPDFRA